MSVLRILATALLLAVVSCSTSLAASVSLCSLPSTDRLSALPSLSLSRLAPTNRYAQFADEAYAYFVSEMYDDSPHRMWLRLQVGSHRPSNYWNTAIALHTLLQYNTFDLNRGGKGARTVQLVERLVERQRSLNESDPQLRNLYNDDMSWMIHALTSLYDHTGNATYLDVATLLFDTVKQSDDTTCCGDWKDGVWWDIAKTSKATAAQAGVTMAALRLRESNATAYSQKYFLDYATHHFWFWRLYMVNNATGQVCDNINLKGRKTWWSFSYNNGLMLGDAVHLYHATNDTQYVKEARFLAAYLVNVGQNVSVNGTMRRILADDAANGCSDDVAEFHQVGYQYLSEYYRLLVQLAASGQANEGSGLEWVADESCAMYDFLQANVDSLWLNARHQYNGTYVFDCNFSGKNEGKPGLQGSMNQAVSAFSLFADLPVCNVEMKVEGGRKLATE